MKPFSNTFAKRKTAVMVLLAWLFALVSGVANACLLETPGTHAHVVAAVSGGAHISTVMAGHTGAVADHHDESPAAKAPCLKVCDDSSNVLVTQPSLSQTDTGPAPLVRVLWLVAAADRVEPFPTGDPGPAAPELPLRVRYSRLAL
jgi:hypothetical protein